MTMSAKLTAVSVFALSAFAAGSLVFAGCTVTSGTVDNTDSGTVKPKADSGGETPQSDAGNPDAAPPAAVCAGSKQATDVVFFGAICQSKLNEVCCAESKTCFDIVLKADPAGARGTDDCNAFARCTDTCRTKKDGTPETDDAKIKLCEKDCEALTQDSVVKAYDAIFTCGADKANKECTK